ncbi:MAG: TonB family protein [Bryobacteraceae bacterium]|nr:TonB family protein [Bryobacteraceae bacterium]
MKRGGIPALATLLLAVLPAQSQQPKAGTTKVKPARLIHRVSPEYSEAARSAGVQGRVIFEVVVNTSGTLEQIKIVSPLDFGLDERAEQAIRQWRYSPAEKDGKPVAIQATIEVNFLFREKSFDDKQERRRNAYNIAVTRIKAQDKVADSLATLQALAAEDYPPAQAVVGAFLLHGEHLPRDPVKALLLLRRAADRNNSAALFLLGTAELRGDVAPKNVEAGMRKLEDAAHFGSQAAQYEMGRLHEKGSGVPLDLEKAARYFRLCAARGDARCQVRLGSLLLARPDRSPRDLVQAVAWLELAGDSNDAASRKLLDAALTELNPEQRKNATTLREQLARNR